MSRHPTASPPFVLVCSAFQVPSTHRMMRFFGFAPSVIVASPSSGTFKFGGIPAGMGGHFSRGQGVPRLDRDSVHCPPLPGDRYGRLSPHL